MMGTTARQSSQTVYGDLRGNTTPLASLRLLSPPGRLGVQAGTSTSGTSTPKAARALLKSHCSVARRRSRLRGTWRAPASPRQFRDTLTAPPSTPRAPRVMAIVSPAEGHRHRDRRFRSAGERRVRPDGHAVFNYEPRQLRVGHVARSRRLSCAWGAAAFELHSVLQPRGDSHARGRRQRAQPDERGSPSSRRPTQLFRQTTSRDPDVLRGRSGGPPPFPHIWEKSCIIVAPKKKQKKNEEHASLHRVSPGQRGRTGNWK